MSLFFISTNVLEKSYFLKYHDFSKFQVHLTNSPNPTKLLCGFVKVKGLKSHRALSLFPQHLGINETISFIRSRFVIDISRGTLDDFHRLG